MATPRKTTTRKKTLTPRQLQLKKFSKVAMVMTNGGWAAAAQLKGAIPVIAPAVGVATVAFFVAWLALTLVEVKEQ